VPATHLTRKGAGQPLREAMQARGMSGPDLAEATRRVDPTGKGVSAAVIGMLAGQGTSARERCRFRTAWLIAEGLDVQIHRLFSMPTPSTATVEKVKSDESRNR
jgi:hypothetical protein